MGLEITMERFGGWENSKMYLLKVDYINYQLNRITKYKLFFTSQNVEIIYVYYNK